MGLKYVSSESSSLINALSSNLNSVQSSITSLQTGANQLIAAVDGKTLSGAAYRAAAGLFQDCIIPAIEKTKTAIDSVNTDLSTYKTQDATVSGEGILDEDNLNSQLSSLKAQKKAAETAARMAGTEISRYQNSIDGTDYGSLISNLTSVQTQFTNLATGFGNDIAEVERKLRLLQNFSSGTNGLFSSSLDGLSVSMQAVMVLSQTLVNDDGTYSLPAEVDASWFKSKQKNVQNSAVYALYNMPANMNAAEATDWILQQVGKYGMDFLDYLKNIADKWLPRLEDTNKSVNAIIEILQYEKGEAFLNGVKLTIDKVGRVRWGSKLIYRPGINGNKPFLYSAGREFEDAVGKGFKISDLYDEFSDSTKGTKNSMVSFFEGSGRNLNNGIKDFVNGLKFWEDFDPRGWKGATKLAKVGKFLGAASTVSTVWSDWSDNTTGGKTDWVGTGTDIAVDVAAGSAAIATGSAIGSMVGTALFPPVGTVVGYAAGAAIGWVINNPYGNPPKSAVDHVKSGVKSAVKGVGNFFGSIAKQAFGG